MANGPTLGCLTRLASVVYVLHASPQANSRAYAECDETMYCGSTDSHNEFDNRSVRADRDAEQGHQRSTFGVW